MGKYFMKSDIKKLYKKDKKLAIQVAKVLGYKIIISKVTSEEQNKKQATKNFDFIFKKINKEINKIKKYVDKTNNLVHKKKQGSVGELNSATSVLDKVYQRLSKASDLLVGWWTP